MPACSCILLVFTFCSLSCMYSVWLSAALSQWAAFLICQASSCLAGFGCSANIWNIWSDGENIPMWLYLRQAKLVLWGPVLLLPEAHCPCRLPLPLQGRSLHTQKKSLSQLTTHTWDRECENSGPLQLADLDHTSGHTSFVYGSLNGNGAELGGWYCRQAAFEGAHWSADCADDDDFLKPCIN